MLAKKYFLEGRRATQGKGCFGCGSACSPQDRKCEEKLFLGAGPVAALRNSRIAKPLRRDEASGWVELAGFEGEGAAALVKEVGRRCSAAWELKRFQRRTLTRVTQANLARGIFDGLAAKLKISKTFQEPLGNVLEAAEESDWRAVVVLG